MIYDKDLADFLGYKPEEAIKAMLKDEVKTERLLRDILAVRKPRQAKP